MVIQKIVRKAYPPNGKPAFVVQYAPTPNITQEAIDTRVQPDLKPATRTHKLHHVSGDHPFVLESQISDPDNPGNFIATWENGPELRSSLCDENGKPGPLLDAWDNNRTDTDSVPQAAHAYTQAILPAGSTPDGRPQALYSADRRHWRFAMDAEHDQLEGADTWDLVPRSEAKNIITGKWVLKIKKDSSGNITRYKARWVARGFSQRHGIDYSEIFAPVVRYSSIRLLLSIANRKNLDLYGLDVSNAFARAIVDEDIFVEQPHGFVQFGMNKTPLVCKLKKGLYGTKQAARLWHQTYRRHLLADGWVPYESDSCIFSRNTKQFGLEYIGIYVDDAIHLCENKAAHTAFNAYCNTAFPTESQGELHWILNCRVTRDRKNRTLWLDQSQSVRDFLNKWDLKTPSTPRSNPMSDNWKYGDGPP
jgi:hypothetical protein